MDGDQSLHHDCPEGSRRHSHRKSLDLASKTEVGPRRPNRFREIVNQAASSANTVSGASWLNRDASEFASPEQPGKSLLKPS